MKIAFGTDEITPLTKATLDIIEDLGHESYVVANGLAWPVVGKLVGEAVAHKRADRGVVICTTGTGVSIAANKVQGVRASLCTDAVTAECARRWNDANVLAFGLRLTTQTVVREMLTAFFETLVDEDAVELIRQIEPNLNS